MTSVVSTDSSKQLQGKVALVTGASSGIGQAVALEMARAGCAVALCARRLDMLTQVRSAVETEGGRSIAISTDVTDRNSVAEAVRHTEVTLGNIDILVNCAGVMYYTLMKNVHLEEWERQIDVNCKGVLNCIAKILPGMVERGSGHIVNISSDAGRFAFPGLAVYTGTKFFVEGMSRAMRMELAQTGVKVCCIQPGDVRTPLQVMSTDDEAIKLYCGEESGTRMLEAEDIGRAIIYALTQPEYVAVNEVLVEPRGAPA